jgi:hypothetical protein
MYLSDGNLRMNIPTWSLPAEKTCPNATIDCMNNCYAKKAERMYRNTRESRARNLNDSKRKDFTNKMIGLIKKKKSKYIRIHESGDFYSKIYLDKWIDICNKFPRKKFLAYTQSYDLDWSKKPDNLIVYWSVWPDSKNVPKNGGRINSYKNKPNGFKCKKGHGTKITCDKCLYCFEGKGDVIFKIH